MRNYVNFHFNFSPKQLNYVRAFVISPPLLSLSRFPTSPFQNHPFPCVRSQHVINVLGRKRSERLTTWKSHMNIQSRVRKGANHKFLQSRNGFFYFHTHMCLLFDGSSSSSGGSSNSKTWNVTKFQHTHTVISITLAACQKGEKHIFIYEFTPLFCVELKAFFLLHFHFVARERQFSK